MLVGYARISTLEQTLDLQQDALRKIGCEQIFTDTASGAKADRLGLEEALSFVRTGDLLVVWRLDRLGRSLYRRRTLRAARPNRCARARLRFSRLFALQILCAARGNAVWKT
jgi:DNA invertase Pin-like site-specific DNA recombinase